MCYICLLHDPYCSYLSDWHESGHGHSNKGTYCVDLNVIVLQDDFIGKAVETIVRCSETIERCSDSIVSIASEVLTIVSEYLTVVFHCFTNQMTLKQSN